MSPNPLRACPLCASHKAKFEYSLPKADELECQTRACLFCGMVYMSPAPSQAYLDAYYAQVEVYDYSSDQPQDYRRTIADKIRLIQGFMSKFPSLPRQGQALDFGAGQGATVKALSELDFRAKGIEISKAAQAAAHKLFGVKLSDGPLERLDDASLDWLTMFDVLEHMLEPLGILRVTHQKLGFGGACLIGVPNYNSLDRIMRGAKSKAMIFPDHVNQFTKISLQLMVEKAGFSVLYIGSPPPYGLGFSLGLRRHILKTLGRSRLTLALNEVISLTKRYIVYPLPNLFVEKTGLFGHSLLVLARKT
jgi:2-polyprenyl-3-methyl-5-hydroxy-6-metoxy-1,4-benzoquinol methylase